MQVNRIEHCLLDHLSIVLQHKLSEIYLFFKIEIKRPILKFKFE